MRRHCTCSLFKRVLVAVVYMTVVVVQLYLWPICDDSSSYTLEDDLEDMDVELPPMPSNLLSPPLWNSRYHSGHCGTWQKQYTKLHRAMLSGGEPPSYLVYTTGRGFPPPIEGVPHALKGIATVLMLAILTDRAFILDWKSPAGFERIFTPRYIDWTSGKLFKGDYIPTKHVHNIGTPYWFDSQNGRVDWYMNTNFDDYFTEEVEVVQSHSYDFTYALLRNKHYQYKIRNLGLHNAKCWLCCMWHYLFKFTPLFVHNMNALNRNKLGLTNRRDLIFLNIPFQSENLPKNLVLQHASTILRCADKVSRTLRNPVWALASNRFVVLEELPKMMPKMKSSAIFHSNERYLVDLQRDNATQQREQLQLKVPRTEHSALMYYFLGFYLQMNSTVLFSQPHSPFSETMAALRYFYHPTKYIVYPKQGCHLQKYRSLST